MTSILFLDEDAGRKSRLEDLLAATGKFRVLSNVPVADIPAKFRIGFLEAVIVVHGVQEANPVAILKSLRESDPHLPVVILTFSYDARIAEEALAGHAQYCTVPEPGPASLPALIMAIENAVEIHRAQAQIAFLIRKLNLVGSVTRHDVLNQLTAVNGYNELILMMIEDPTILSYLKKEQTAVDRVKRQFRYAKDYQNLANDPPRWQLVLSAVHRASENANLGQVRLVGSCGNTTVFADPYFENAITYLFENAIHAGGNVTEIRIFIEERGADKVLVFEDDGRGVPAGDKEKIFEPTAGPGWGLFLVREILAITGIRIAETGSPGKGTRFEILIPGERFRISEEPAHPPSH